MSKSRKLVSKNNKKNNYTMKKCKSFCKNDYKPEMEKMSKKRAQEEKYSSFFVKFVKDAKKKYPSVCQKIYCNPDCKEGYTFNGDKAFESKFRKKLKNGFVEDYSASEVKMLKKKGALSGCSKVGKNYQYGYNVFHK